MSTRDIHAQIQDLYNIEVSTEMVSKITDKVLSMVQEWQNQPLEAVYPFVFMDAIHYKVREDEQIVNKAAYVVMGVDTDGCKVYWLGILNELKNRGTENVLIFSVDVLNGFPEAIQATFPQSKIQRCIIH